MQNCLVLKFKKKNSNQTSRLKLFRFRFVCFVVFFFSMNISAFFLNLHIINTFKILIYFAGSGQKIILIFQNSCDTEKKNILCPHYFGIAFLMRDSSFSKTYFYLKLQHKIRPDIASEDSEITDRKTLDLQ